MLYIMAEENIDYGESEVETTVVSSNYAKIDDLVLIGQQIYQDVLDYSASQKDKKVHKTLQAKTAKEYTDILSRLLTRHKPLSTRKEIVPKEDDDEVDLNSTEYRVLVKNLQEKYKDFNTSFPIFIRWTVQTGEFDTGALREFLRKHATSKLRTMDDFLMLQTKYVTYLYKARHPHWNTSEIVRLADQLMTALIKEEKEFKKVSKEVEAEMKETEAENAKFLREKLLQLLRIKGHTTIIAASPQ